MPPGKSIKTEIPEIVNGFGLFSVTENVSPAAHTGKVAGTVDWISKLVCPTPCRKKKQMSIASLQPLVTR